MMIADLTKDLIGKEYELGKMDCLRLVYDYLKPQMDLPDEFHGVTLANYVDVYESNPIDALSLLEEFIASVLDEVKDCDVRPGDIIIVRFAYMNPFPAIVVGNGKAIFVTEEGVMTIHLSKLQVERVFRCQGR